MKRWKVRIEFKIQDLWIGVFWKWTQQNGTLEADNLDIWICFIPCLPVHITGGS